MDNDHLYNKQLQALERSVKIRPKRIKGTRRSVVACIVRKPKVKHEKAPLDMFFILRASDPNGSRWSGQVGKILTISERLTSLGLEVNGYSFKFMVTYFPHAGYP